MVNFRRDDPLATALRGVLRGAGSQPARAAIRSQQAAGPRAADAPAAAAQRWAGAARAHRLAGTPAAQGNTTFSALIAAEERYSLLHTNK